MSSRKKLLRNSALYAIFDTHTVGKDRLAASGRAFGRSGIDILQLRDKLSSRREVLAEAQLLKKALAGKRTLFIINDYTDIALLVDSDGVHVGQDDLPVEKVRQLIGSHKIIGVSCHTIRQALDAQKRGADYIGIGPIFSTPTKPEGRAIGLDLVKECARKIRIPFFVIGGIDLNTLPLVRQAGARRAAVCRLVCESRSLKKTINTCTEILKNIPCLPN